MTDLNIGKVIGKKDLEPSQSKDPASDGQMNVGRDHVTEPGSQETSNDPTVNVMIETYPALRNGEDCEYDGGVLA